MSWNVNEDLTEVWELEEASGNRVGALGNYNLVPVNASSGRNAGRLGTYGFEVLGVWSSWLDLSPAAMTGQTEFTFTFWIYPTATPGTSGYFRLIEMGSGTSNRITYTWRDANVAGSASTGTQSASSGSYGNVWAGAGPPNPYTDWHFMAVTFSASMIQMYYGSATGKVLSKYFYNSATFNPSQITYTSVRLLGGSYFNNSNTGETWQGTCDQIGYWRRALTFSELKWLFNKGAGRTASTIIAGRTGAFAMPKTTGLTRVTKFPTSAGDNLPAEGQLFPLKI